MSPKGNLPSGQGLLHRLRLDMLIQKGLHQSLLVVLAGPGYGKTIALSDYLARRERSTIWLRLRNLDNLPSHFWDRIIQALKREYPALAKRLQALDFPDSPSSFDVFARLLEAYFYGDQPVIWVFDDYGEINDHRIIAFFRQMCEMDLPHFHLVLISNAIGNTHSIGFSADHHAVITAEDLRFTQDEIYQLYQLYDVRLDPDELSAIDRYTEGWPLPLHLLVQHYHWTSNPQEYLKGTLTNNAVFLMFEDQFFHAYSQRQQRLLVQLSLLSFFTKEIAASLCGGDEDVLAMLENHVFITNEPETKRCFFHHLYHIFLKGKKHLVDKEGERQVWQRAAAHYITSGDVLEAITCYRKCGDFARMLEAISSFIQSQEEVTEYTAAFFLEHIDLLTPEQVQKYPVAECLRARVYMSTLQLSQAEALLLDLEQRLLQGNEADKHALLINVYAMLGNIHMMRNQEDFGAYYEKAAAYLPEKREQKGSGKLMTLNIHTFSMSDNQPGAKERMERAVHYGVPWMAKVLLGAMSGMEHIFSAEAAYLSGEMAQARQHALRGVEKAAKNDQHDLVCNGYGILARIWYMQGNYQEMKKQIRNIAEHAGAYDIGILREIRDTALGWYYIKLRDNSMVPKSILRIIDTEQPILAHGRPQIVYANYLLNNGEYAKLIGMLEHPKGLFLSSGIWPDRICLFIMLAIGYYRLGNGEKSMEALWQAYDMSYHNGLIALFIEGDHYMLELIQAARGQSKYLFSEEWLAQIEGEALAFSKRAECVRAAYQKQKHIDTAKRNPLSKRERQVLQALSQGLTRDEIASKQYISVNTVKSVIRNIYSKLEASNRAEAVSIAMARGYIEGYHSQ